MVEKDTPGMSFGAKEKKVELICTSSCVLAEIVGNSWNEYCNFSLRP